VSKLRQTAVDKYIAAENAKKKNVEIRSLTDLQALMLGGPPLPTQTAFLNADDVWCAYKGSIGSAKTTAGVTKVLFRLLTLPGSKGLIARGDYNDLIDTTMRTAEMILTSRLPPGLRIGRSKAPPEKWILRPIVEGPPSELTFMGLKDELGSYEFDIAFIDEANEVEERVAASVRGRLRNKPYEGYEHYSLNLAFNPPDMNHWLYTACTGKDAEQRIVKPPYMRLFEPSPRENETNLPPGYYDNQVASMPPDMQERLLNNKWGSIRSGDPVYREFSRTIHVARNVRAAVDGALLRFWDFGYHHPACIFATLTPSGQLKVHRAVMGKDTEARKFAQDMKLLTAEHYPWAQNFIDIGDPAVKQQKDTGSTLQVLYEEGIVMRFAHSFITDGVDVIRRLLSTLNSGAPGVIFDEENCRVLIEGLAGGYYLDEKRKPVKDGYYDHLCDAFRYGVHMLFGNGASPQLAGMMYRAMGATNSYTQAESVEYRPENDPYYHPYFDRK
jgi:hypothetical protein